MAKDLIATKLETLRREQILEAATKVFAEKGFRAARMQEVAATAGVANGTVYNYFASKDELLLALLEELSEHEWCAEQITELRSGAVEAVFLPAAQAAVSEAARAKRAVAGRSARTDRQPRVAAAGVRKAYRLDH